MTDLITALNALELHSFDGNHSEYVLVDDLAKALDGLGVAWDGSKWVKA